MTDADRMVVWLLETMDAAQRDAEAATPGPWSVRPDPDTGENWEIATVGREQRWVVGAEHGGGVYDKPDALHIVRHDPAAVLRRIAADRKMLDLHQSDEGHCAWASTEPMTDPCTTVRLLAEGYGWKDGQQ